MSWHRFVAMARKEVIQLRRDVRSLLLAFGLPLILVLIFGYAISLDVTNISMGLYDQDRSRQSRQIIDVFEGSGYFTVTHIVERAGDIDGLLQRGHVQLVVVIPPDFSRDLAARRGARLQVLLDGSDANTATIAQNYAGAIVAGASPQLSGAGHEPPPLAITAESRVWFNESLESRNSIVPALVAVIMAIIAAMLTALTVAREWERGTMEQLAATPVHRLEVILGKLAPYIAIGLIDVAIAGGVGIMVFDVPFRGNAALLLVMTLLFLVGVLGFGVFLSAALKSQLLATQFAIMSTYLPTLLLSGFIFAISGMPLVLRMLSYVLPARYFVVITRGIFLKDVGIEILWTQALGLVVYATVGLGLATAAFRKRIA